MKPDPFDNLPQELLRQALSLMEEVVRRPERLDKSAYACARLTSSAKLARKTTTTKALSRNNSLRKSVKEVKLRSVAREKSADRPSSYVG